MKIYEEPVVEIMVICGFYHNNSDFFLSKKKTTLGRDSWGLYVVIYFKKTSLALSHFFFDLGNTFCKKGQAIFSLFVPENRGPC